MGLAGLLQNSEVREQLKKTKGMPNVVSNTDIGTPLGVAMNSIMDKPKETKKKMAKQTMDMITPGGESLLKQTSKKSNTMVGY